MVNSYLLPNWSIRQLAKMAGASALRAFASVAHCLAPPGLSAAPLAAPAIGSRSNPARSSVRRPRAMNVRMTSSLPDRPGPLPRRSAERTPEPARLRTTLASPSFLDGVDPQSVQPPAVAIQARQDEPLARLAPAQERAQSLGGG